MRLVNRLSCTNTSFFIHVDKGADIKQFLQTELSSKATFVSPRMYSPWGGLGIVRATINGIESIVNSRFYFDYIVLLSGQDYPVLSNDCIFSRLGANGAKTNYIDCLVMRQGVDHEEFRRIQKWHVRIGTRIHVYPAQSISRSTLERTSQRLARLIFGKYPRTFLPNLTPVFGSQWWVLNREAIAYIRKYLAENPDFLSFYRYSLLPDEMVFQTILLGTGNEELQASIPARSEARLMFTHWDRPDELYPKPLTMDDYPAIRSSNKLFARKFDPVSSKDLLIRLDQDQAESSSC